MPSPARPAFACAAWLLVAGTAAGAADLQYQEGLAHDRDGALAYREAHWRWSDGGREQRLVLYRCPDGRPFARKRVAADATGAAPDFAFEDARDGYREGVRSDRAGRTVYVVENRDDAERERTLAPPAGAVIDAGFDAAVRANLDTLRAGQVLARPFLLPSRLDFVPIRIEPGALVEWRGVPAQRLTMKLDRWYGFVAPRMQLTYAVDDGRLLEFAGIATIRDAGVRHQDVRIAFAQPPAPAPAPAAGLAQAQSAPLVRSCDR